jgi:cytolysin (calcineurin-like family phosphatase)
MRSFRMRLLLVSVLMGCQGELDGNDTDQDTSGEESGDGDGDGDTGDGDGDTGDGDTGDGDDDTGDGDTGEGDTGEGDTGDGDTGDGDGDVGDGDVGDGDVGDGDGDTGDGDGDTGDGDGDTGDGDNPDAGLPPVEEHIDVTFFVVADAHVDPLAGDGRGDPARDSNFGDQAVAAAIHKVAREGSWPSSVGGQATDFVGGAIGDPKAVVFVGDLTGWGVAGTEIPSFRHYYQAGNDGGSMKFPAYLGLGNHDVDDADRTGDWAKQNRDAYWALIDERHKGGNAPVRTGNFDSASHAYSWDIGGVHFVQLHRHPGDNDYGLASSVGFLENDLEQYASDGKPLFLFHHYGMDKFGREERWWTDAERATYRDVLADYNVAGIMVGHSHAAFNYEWEGMRVFHTNNAKAEINTGNKDGNGSFSIVRITDTRLNWVTCRWLDGQGNYELVGPFYAGDAHR